MQNYAYVWPEGVVLNSGPRAALHAVIPNLNRRPERWIPCHQKLLRDADFPAAQIQRFSAFDYKDFADLREAKKSAATRFYGLPPALSREDMVSSNFCWLFTWYAMMEQISLGAPDEYYLMMLDDCAIHLDYEKLRTSIDVLSKNVAAPVIIQLSRNPRKMQHRRMVAALDIWQYGLCGRTDAGYILSPEGATTIIKRANDQLPIVPADVLESLSYDEDQLGYYSLSAKYEREGRGSAGAVEIFLGKLELQDRLGSTKYK